MRKTTAKTYQVEQFFNLDKRVRLRYHKMINLYDLYETVILFDTHGEMKQEIYNTFRNKNFKESVIDTFWNRFIKVQLQREEELQERNRRIKQIELENRRKGRTI